MNSLAPSWALLALSITMAACGASVAPIVGDARPPDVAIDVAIDATVVDATVDDATAVPDSNESVIIEDPPENCPAETWCWQSPSPQGRPIYAVFAASDSEAWAVGQQGTVMRFRDGRWSAQPSISAANLAGLWGDGPDHVWTWGSTSPPDTRIDVQRWDGVRWQSATGLSSAPLLDLHGSARDNVWLARGRPVDASFIERWNGTTSSIVAALPERRQPSSICVRAATEAWATAGDIGNAAVRYVYRFDGAAWSLAHRAGSNERLTSKITCPADGVAVVEQRSIDNVLTFIEIRGSAVNRLASPLTERATLVRSRRGEAYVVSDREAVRWTPRGWERAFSAGRDRALSPEFDLAPSGSVGWMANGTPFLASFSAGTWSADPQWRFQQLSVFPTITSEVEPTDPTVVFGNLVWAKRVSNGWQISRSPMLPSGSRFDAHQAWGVTMNEVWIVGARGAIMKYDARTQQLTLADVDAQIGTADLYAIDGSDANNVWVVGSNGTVLRLEGGRWVAVPPPNRSGTLNDVRVEGASSVYVEGESGYFRWNGSEWVRLSERVGVRDSLGDEYRLYSTSTGALQRRIPMTNLWQTVEGAMGPFRNLRLGRSGRIELLGSRGAQLALYEIDSRGRLSIIGAPLEGAGVLDIVHGANGSLWAAGAYGGILRYQRRR